MFIMSACETVLCELKPPHTCRYQPPTREQKTKEEKRNFWQSVPIGQDQRSRHHSKRGQPGWLWQLRISVLLPVCSLSKQ